MRESQAIEAERPVVQDVAPATAVAAAPTLVLASHLGNRAFAAHALAGGGRPRRPALARYQPGEAGHGGIEEEGLGKAGFSPEDIKSTYFGNWLRDFSQMGKSGERPPQLMLLLNILALGEFGRELTDADLGTYVPSEHMDNPEGGGTAEDPNASPADKEASLAKMSPQQLQAYERQREAGVGVLAESATGLPGYIEKGKFHAKEELAEAVKKGENQEGMQALGNGLHAVEDYFSHSNYTEACIVTLDREHDPTVKPLMDLLLKTTLGHDLATLTPEDPDTGRIQIQTGTYAPGANEDVSLVEALVTELNNGELRRTFIKGSIRATNLTIDKALDALHGAGLVSTLLTAELVNAIALVDVACRVFGEEAVMKAFGFTTPSLDSLLGKKADEKTTTSGQEAKSKGLSGPTHSELAKDSPDNPLFPVSRALAVEADKQIGEKIKEVWATMPKESKEPDPAPTSTPADPPPQPGSGSAPATPSTSPGPAGQTPQQEAVTTLVNKFVSNPADDQWWVPIVREAAAGPACR